MILGLNKMEIMKTSIKAILDNIEKAQEFLDEKAIDEFEDIIMDANNVLLLVQVDQDLLQRHLQ